MPKLNIKKQDMPLLLGGKGNLSVDTGSLSLTSPLDETDASVFSVKLNAAGDRRVQFGQGKSAEIEVSKEANVTLTPVFSSSPDKQAKLLKLFGAAAFFRNGSNTDKVVLIFDTGAAAGLSASGSFRYAALSAGFKLEAGINGRFGYMKALSRDLTIRDLMYQFFRTMRLPEQGIHAPQPGEAISLQYGGYLRLGAEISTGYSLRGTKSVSLAELDLSEEYKLSVIGRIALSARVAGDYSILVSCAEEADFNNWARVRVRRRRSRELKFAADVNMGFANAIETPATADEFLGAALGVNAKNILNVLAKAHELSDFEKFRGATDKLAQRFVGELMHKGFAELTTKAEFNKFLAIANNVTESYQTVGDRAVTLFDRYFDRLDELTGVLKWISELDEYALQTVRKRLNPTAWNILSQLTDGDPLGFLVGKITIGNRKIDSLDELKRRAQDALALIQDRAHGNIRGVIATAKESLGIDRLFRELAELDSPDELKSLADEKVGLFVSRLVGRSLASSADIKEAFKETKKVLDNLDEFRSRLYKTFKNAAQSSYKFALHAEYSRASETNNLIDVLINMNKSRGAELLAQAGKGNFGEILLNADPNLVRLKEGVFTHRTHRESAFNINIFGWHLNYHYEGFDRVITETKQRLIPSAHGISVFTQVGLEIERERKKQEEKIHSNFLLRALAESKGVMDTVPGTTGHIMGILTSLISSYQLRFTDDNTSRAELEDCLAFARELGLDKNGATVAGLSPFLAAAPGGDFGKVTAVYDVKFNQQAVDALLSIDALSELQEYAIRSAMRQLVLSNYLRADSLHDVAFAYATPGTFATFRKSGANFVGGLGIREFPVSLPSSLAISAPYKVHLSNAERRFLETLYNIENRMVKAVKILYRELGSQRMKKPLDLEERLADFGRAMNDFDSFDQTNGGNNAVGASTMYAVFDALLRMVTGSTHNNTAMLTISNEVDGEMKEKVFLALSE
jgi:hypothetical protein